MKFMTRAAYRGKIVLNMEGEPSSSALPPRHAAFVPRSQLPDLRRGASGFGLEIARWMVERGARHLVLLSRSGCKTDADREAVETIMEQGVEVLLAQADVSDPKAMTRLMGRIRSTLPPLAGVIHGAAVLDDASLPGMDMAKFERVFNPEGPGRLEPAPRHDDHRRAARLLRQLSSISSVRRGCSARSTTPPPTTSRMRLPSTAGGAWLARDADQSRRARTIRRHVAAPRRPPPTSSRLGKSLRHARRMSPPEVLAKLEAALVQQPVRSA